MCQHIMYTTNLNLQQKGANTNSYSQQMEKYSSMPEWQVNRCTMYQDEKTLGRKKYAHVKMCIGYL